ncbi:MAG: histidinol dehydrogenase [Rickettsiales bacterium]|nr:histidinol dehydrogenase [Rickettsiales bacterium]|tara:strand:- start:1363 stop:2634 length:1272 start_codon:yes stop_codon:yes gene_type:complete
MIEIKTKSEYFEDESNRQNLETENVYNLLIEIKKEIKSYKDKALFFFTEKFDQVKLADIIVSEAEIEKAKKIVSKEFVDAISVAKENITTFHQNQCPYDWEEDLENGISYGMQYSAIEKAGLYVPGGRALYPSTVLMNAIPAKLAGVSELIITTPPQKDGSIAPEILVAADICDVDTIIKAGGAQAIFALAYGTESVPKVDKIVGPGNMYVDQAKQMVYGLCDIDKPAGPSEVCVYIEDLKYAHFAAAELLAQLEHDPDASVVAVSTDKNVLKAIQQECVKQLKSLKRKDIILESAKNSSLIRVKSKTEAIDILNEIASEHLALIIDDANTFREKIKHAGSIFCGPNTPVALGDYIAGPNHVLPTGKAARFSSPLSVMDFMKFSSHLTYGKENLETIKAHVKTLTTIEQLDAHFESINQRLKD